VIPTDQPNRAELIKILIQLATAFEKYQDKKTGLWYQVVDKGSVPGNWLETSASSMYTYAMWVGAMRGYLPNRFRNIALKGYKGVLTQISTDKDGTANIENICEGTNVSDINYYFARKRNTNDFHGIGAFLIMNEELRTAKGGRTQELDWKLR
jgi:unsaturated rhamnogalacturonyl hydrolase